MSRPAGWVEDGVVAGLAGAALSGIPSTVHALACGRDVLEPTLAAGSLLLPRETRRARLVLAAVPVHLALSIWWGLVLARLLPRGASAAVGAGAGVAIAALDLGVVGRAIPRIGSLPWPAQLADHAAFGAIVASVLRRRAA